MASGYQSFSEIRAALTELPRADSVSIGAAQKRDSVLTKPAGSLGRLEAAVSHLAGWQRRAVPQLESVHILVFAGNHGITAQGVSAYPAEVTMQMVANFQRGGAAINQLAQLHNATLSVIPLELERPTADFTGSPAMSEPECLAAINAGVAAVPESCDLLLAGEMGIGNTTAAAALAAALYGGDGQSWVGPGTGVTGTALANKIRVVDHAVALHGQAARDPLQALRCLGGRELAAIFGALLEARRRSMPVLLDGFVVGAAAAVLARLDDRGLDHCLAGHVSAEPGHRRLLELLGKAAFLDLGMRLGEASGASVALGILRAAVACHAGMATFAEAGVSDRDQGR